MAVLLGASSTGANSANNNGAGISFSQRLTALASGNITRIALRVGTLKPTSLHGAIYADTTGPLPGARLTADEVILNAAITAGAYNFITLTTPLAVVSGTVYWICFLPVGNSIDYTDNATTGGTEKDKSGQTTCVNPYGSATGSNANIANVYADDFGAAVASIPDINMAALR